MLEQLNVKNYALIDELEVQFTRGFNVLTGETGAGKSILIGAVGLLLGQKGDASSIREGCDQLEVSGSFRVEGLLEVREWLEAREIEDDDGRIIIRRVIKSNGRSSSFVQGSPVTKNDLEELSSLMIDLHGQNEHQSLLQLENHRKFLDLFGNTADLDRRLYEKFARLAALRKEYDSLNSQEKERLREIELLTFAAGEIEKAALKAGEEEELLREKNLLSQAEKLYGHLEILLSLSGGEEGSMLKSLRVARDELSRIAAIDEGQAGLAERLDGAYYEIEDIVEAVRDYRDGMDFSPQRLEACESRLAEIRRLEKKYGSGAEAVNRYRLEALEKIEVLKNWEDRQAEFKKQMADLEKEILENAAELSARRKKAAETLGGEVRGRLSRLGMEKADFKIRVEPKLGPQGKPSCGPHGWDQIEFLISPNLGEPLKPLKSVASGGEVSRVMLAIKSVLSDSDDIPALIFDEVDAGIGGEVALAVGEYIAKIAETKQVLCITHLASIAVRADNHIKVEKTEKDGRTLTVISVISGEEEVREISRMLSGDSKGELSLSHAGDLLKKYRPSR